MHVDFSCKHHTCHFLFLCTYSLHFPQIMRFCILKSMIALDVMFRSSCKINFVLEYTMYTMQQWQWSIFHKLTVGIKNYICSLFSMQKHVPLFDWLLYTTMTKRNNNPCSDLPYSPHKHCRWGKLQWLVVMKIILIVENWLYNK